MKIVYCLDSIRGVGGIQRVTVTKANALAGVPGNTVWIVVADTSGEQVYAVSPQVHVADLDIRYYEDDWKSRWNVLKGIFLKRRTHRSRLEALLREIGPDVVVSVGESEKNFLGTIRGKWMKVREIHYAKNYRHLAASSFFERLLAIGGDLYDYHWKIRRYDRIVVLTQGDRNNNWHGEAKVRVIPNPLPFHSEICSPLKDKRILAVGHLTATKNFRSLVRSFRRVSDRFPQWRLDILGDGEERPLLEEEIARLSLEGQVRLRGSVTDIRKEMLSASLLVMTSRFEGFGMALVEAMHCGLPVVAYDCPEGPKAIISDGLNGYLVPPGDESALSERICSLIEDPKKRCRMGIAARISSRRYEIDQIVPMWMDLFSGR
ncbi:MAG: glycosyltransferase family 4 protein [Bacteroidales bacterium]|nr:glycosyltransferase family 4 protein [Bacteroidales bacterium]